MYFKLINALNFSKQTFARHKKTADQISIIFKGCLRIPRDYENFRPTIDSTRK
jgi:hypothetical protein